eukprot:scaffold4066_cov417-Prasinococcus_capsulatus_cf.AAC.3
MGDYVAPGQLPRSLRVWIASLESQSWQVATYAERRGIGGDLVGLHYERFKLKRQRGPPTARTASSAPSQDGCPLSISPTQRLTIPARAPATCSYGQTTRKLAVRRLRAAPRAPHLSTTLLVPTNVSVPAAVQDACDKPHRIAGCRVTEPDSAECGSVYSSASAASAAGETLATSEGRPMPSNTNSQDRLCIVVHEATGLKKKAFYSEPYVKYKIDSVETGRHTDSTHCCQSHDFLNPEWKEALQTRISRAETFTLTLSIFCARMDGVEVFQGMASWGQPSDSFPSADPRRKKIYVRVMEARNVLAKDFGGTSDPYAKIYLDGVQKAKTQTVNKSLNPKWNEVFGLPYLIGQQPAKNLKIVVYDYDFGQSDDVLGQIEMNVSQLRHLCDEQAPLAAWVPMEAHKNRAKVRGDLKVVAWIGPEDSDVLASTGSSEYLVPSFRYLRVYIQRARDLMAADMDGTSDPYLVATLAGQQTWKTKLKRRTLNPEYNQEFYFLVPNSYNGNEKITFLVKDWDKYSRDDFLGELSFSLKDVDMLKELRWCPLTEQSGHHSMHEAIQKGFDDLGELRAELQDNTREGTGNLMRAISKSRARVSGELRLAMNFEPHYEDRPLPPVGKLKVHVKNAKNISLKTMGVPDTYLVVAFGRRWFRSKTMKDNCFPDYNFKATFDVVAPEQVLTIAIFDDNQIRQKGLRDKLSALTKSKDVCIGKVQIRVGVLEGNTEYDQEYPMIQRHSSRGKETVREVGKLQLSVTFEYSDWKEVYKRYTVSRLGQLHHFRPLPPDARSRLATVCKELSTQYLSQQSPGIRQEVTHEVLGMDQDKLEAILRRSKANVQRLFRALKTTGLMSLTDKYDYVAKWYGINVQVRSGAGWTSAKLSHGLLCEGKIRWYPSVST